MATCPYCGWDADSIDAEVEHMRNAHPSVIRERLESMGVSPDEVADDYRNGPDLPSYMTLNELRQVMVFIERQAVEGVWDELSVNPIVSILVRDSGPESSLPAPWIEFTIDDNRYAIWRATMALYRVGLDGTVDDDPIIRND